LWIEHAWFQPEYSVKDAFERTINSLT
jgi:hypothetical protein